MTARLPRSRVAAPVATLGWTAGLVVLAVGLLVLTAVGTAAAVLPGSGMAVATGGGAVVLLAAVGAGLVGRRAGTTIEAYVDAATSAAPQGSVWAPQTVPVRELDDLFTALAALQQRVRVSDDLAERHRRNADASSAGMFELLSGLVAAEEGARGQLSAELHDTVAQSLGIARRLLSELRPRDGSTGELTAAADQIDEAEESLRATMARTRPPALRDGDLAAAVALLRDDLAMRYGLEVTVVWPDVEYPVPLATAVTVYRFFQEALLNVVKHADVDDAEVSLEVDARHVLATVRDRGVGLAAMPAVAGVGGRHVGLGLLRERARLAGGRVDVLSEAGAGTTLTLRLPRPALTGPQLPRPRSSGTVPSQAEANRTVGVSPAVGVNAVVGVSAAER